MVNSRGVVARTRSGTRDGLLTLDELCERVGMSVRNVRFYTTKGLVPPPIRRGRSGYYSPIHVGRLELVQELQSHGFTLSAIEKYVAGIPADATPEDLALARTMLAPWDVERPIEMSRAELSTRAGRELTEDDLRTLAALGRGVPAQARAVPGRRSPSSSVGLGLLDLGFPVEAALAAADIYARHGREVAKELYDVFRTLVWPVYRDQGASPETVRAGRREDQAALDRRPGRRRTRRRWTRPSAKASPSAR